MRPVLKLQKIAHKPPRKAVIVVEDFRDLKPTAGRPRIVRSGRPGRPRLAKQQKIDVIWVEPPIETPIEPPKKLQHQRQHQKKKHQKHQKNQKHQKKKHRKNKK